MQWMGAVSGWVQGMYGCSGLVPTSFWRLLAWRKNQPHSLFQSLMSSFQFSRLQKYSNHQIVGFLERIGAEFVA